MPGYGLLGADEGPGLLPWSWAAERLSESHCYWLSTSSESGRPHCMPIWAVWQDEALYFSTGGSTRKARNLAHDGRCVVATENPLEAVIVEGRCEIVVAEAHLEGVQPAYVAKYGTAFPADSLVGRVEPTRVFGFIEAPSQFSATATRWIFR